ncbi:acyl-CoA thioesterase [Pseudophaeobacter flagellatus]|uniref:acyl-CoA thioesterase n=1 Tax=Pseudophaeobacter flagellatus TaxID=2899119 RepID=UPI001E3F4F13|nr:thioesterase family protein [Pseudophaeobacter flagellatus]MCD9150028.1 acyl-CoA thioesterase [Pseudophaeobacter flagellatus]
MELRYLTPLTAEEQLAQGLDQPKPMALADRVRFSELDILRHVNNKAYLGWFETARVSYFDQLCAQHFAGMPPPRSVLRNANVHYIREMVLDEPYITTARVISFRNTSYVMEQQIWSGGLRAALEAVMVLRSPDGSAGYPLPEALKRQFTTKDGAKPAQG